MNFKIYQDKAGKTAIYNRQFSVTYPLIGLTGEVGEVANKYQKILRDNNGLVSPEFRHDMKAELGDILWFLSALASDLDLSLEEIAIKNIEKLEDRHQRNVIKGSGDNR